MDKEKKKEYVNHLKGIREKLVELANKNGGADNVSVIIVVK